MRASVIVVAAGMGARMNAGVNKQFLNLLERPILMHTLSVFENHKDIDEIILVLRSDEIEYVKETIVLPLKMNKVINIAIGGLQRSDSVKNGLEMVTHDGLVLIHDGARPLVTHEEITSVINAVKETGAAVVGTPATNTMKLVDGNGLIIDTLDRSKLWNVATPQGFRVDLICRAFGQALDDSDIVWDDSMLVERLGADVRMIEGSYENIKITTPTDIILGESILKERLVNHHGA